MAERRMFSKSIIDSDAFLDMPPSTQNLYFHLSMRADDDGFVNSPKKIQRTINSSDDDMKVLLAKHFIIVFETGILVIKHWRIHNYLRADRYKPTAYTEEFSQLRIKENGVYTIAEELEIPMVDQMDTNGIPDGTPAVCVGKVSIGKVSIGKVRIDKDRDAQPKQEKWKHGEFSNVSLFDDELKKLRDRYGEDQANALIDRMSRYLAQSGKNYKSCYAALLNWANKEDMKEVPKEEKCKHCDGVLVEGICRNPECPQYKQKELKDGF